MIRLLKFSKLFKIFAKKKKNQNLGVGEAPLGPQVALPLFGEIDFLWTKEEKSRPDQKSTKRKH